MVACAWLGQVHWHEHWRASLVGQLHWQVQALGCVPLLVVVAALPVCAAAAMANNIEHTLTSRSFLIVIISAGLS
jgi:hypothetical protein